MTNKASDSIDLIGPVNEAHAPQDEIAPQTPPTGTSEAPIDLETDTRRDPAEQVGTVDIGSLLLALSRLDSANSVSDLALPHGAQDSIPSLPQYHNTDIVPSAPVSGTANPVPSDLVAEPCKTAASPERIDLSDCAAPTDPVDSIEPVPASKPSGSQVALLNESNAKPAGELSRQIPPVRPPARDEVTGRSRRRCGRHRLMAAGLATTVMVAVVGWYLNDSSGVCYPAGQAQASTTIGPAADAVARRIVLAESGGDAGARNKRSTATGAGQFLAGTWLDMIRAYRPDLSRRSEAEILALRYDPEISREMVGRFAEQNAHMLRRRCLPVTAGTLYLSHFAGGAGAVAVLSAPDHADAATTMAEADSRGRTTRDMIVTANPFLRDFTVTDLRKWAERKMRGTGSI